MHLTEKRHVFSEKPRLVFFVDVPQFRQANSYCNSADALRKSPVSRTTRRRFRVTSVSDATSSTEYIYNAENRLIEVGPVSPATGDTRSQFVYDFMGRRVRKTVSEYTAGGWDIVSDKLFVYDGWNLIEEEETVSSESKYYVWGLDLSQSQQGAGGIGGLIASVSDVGDAYYFCHDGNGNVGQLVDALGTLAASYEYNAFGNTLVATGTAADENVFRFSTKYTDESGMVYYGYRYYSPEIGRWLNRDPIGEEGGINIYAFVSNSSIDLLDMLGRSITASCPINKYLKKYLSTSAWTRTKVGEYYKYVSPPNGFASSKPGLILVRMMGSKHNFGISDTDGGVLKNIEAHVESRIRIINNANNAKFAFGVDAAGNPANIVHMDPMMRNYDYLAKPELNPQEYYESVNNTDTSLGCALGTQLVFFGGIGTWRGNYSTRPVEEAVSATSTATLPGNIKEYKGLIPGDMVYIVNTAYDKSTRSPGFEGENLIYVGAGASGSGSLYWGLTSRSGGQIERMSYWWNFVNNWGGGRGIPGLGNWADFSTIGLNVE